MAENTLNSLFLEIGRGEESYWHKSRKKMVSKLLKDYYKTSTNTDRLLDVGCGMGYELSFFKKQLRDTEMYGIDISFEAVCFGRDNYDAHWCRGSVRQLPFASESFDVLICLDVLEHIEDDLTVLHECYRVCKNGGILVISVPACKFLWSEFDNLVFHKRRYYAKELVNRLKEARFEIKRITYAFFTFLPILFLGRGIKKLLFSKASKKEAAINELAKPNSLVDASMYFLLKPEIALISKINFPIGSSLMCVAKKKI